jgi:hypothetical protein
VKVRVLGVVSLWELELAHLDQLEAELVADRVRRRVGESGKACMKRCLSSCLASLIACAVAATAMPRPRNSGTTIQPAS